MAAIAQRLHRDLGTFPAPDVRLIYASPESWCDEILSGENEPVYVSTSENSMLHTVMKNGMDYNAESVLKYVFTRWESMVSRLVEQGERTLRRYDALIERIRRNITAAGMETRLINVIDTREHVNKTLTHLSSTRCITKTPLFVVNDVDVPTLQRLWPSLYHEECDTNSLDDRKIFINPGGSSIWNLRKTMDTARYASVSVPSGFGFEGKIQINRPDDYPTMLGKQRSQVGILLSALDSVATHLFSSSKEYFNWTCSIRDEILEVAGPRPLPPPPPPPPMPDINADTIIITGPVAEDDVDPVTLETFKEGDRVFQMRCCRNKLLQTSIRGILDSGRGAKCPLCRTALLV